ncbi:MAG TPA: glutamate-5-semialdehyde dehydrogenase [Clostridiales bacterium UBA8960]|jgi:glutamate-5-semialdehyde dehydrogenase|nr:glutamate-5-semialdehyde dehydrogenase [Clostridiales bacterium UBA8960]
MTDYTLEIKKMGTQAKEAARFLRTRSTVEKNQLLLEIAKQLNAAKSDIIASNGMDVADARSSGLKEALIERLTLTEKRFEEMVEGLVQVVSLKDPVGEVDGMWLNDSGLQIGARRVPLGVIAMIYESRPNVTIDATALCIKTGNAVILKGGSDALMTNKALMKAVDIAIETCGFPKGSVQLVATTDRDFTKQLLAAKPYIDCVIPRGGAGLIQFVSDHSKVPMIETGTGNCHIYVDSDYDVNKAIEIIKNAKVQRPGACNAVETVLINIENANAVLKQLIETLTEAGVELALCDKSFEIANSLSLDLSSCKLAADYDWETEYLDFKLAVKTVSTLEDAIAHIDAYSSGHSEAILTNHYDHAQKFLDYVDSSTVYVNASTRFTDGGQFGFGAEIGISTQKLHARGPMGLVALTTIKYVVYGNGQIRD